jgi:hypothetical protein
LASRWTGASYIGSKAGPRVRVARWRRQARLLRRTRRWQASATLLQRGRDFGHFVEQIVDARRFGGTQVLASSWRRPLAGRLRGCEMPGRGEALLFSPNATMVGCMPPRPVAAQPDAVRMPCSCSQQFPTSAVVPVERDPTSGTAACSHGGTFSQRIGEGCGGGSGAR